MAWLTAWTVRTSAISYSSPAANAALPRRAAKHSGLFAVVVGWSTARRRYERQGLLVEEGALERAEAECLSDADRREARRRRAAAARAGEDERLVEDFVRAIRRRYPGCPPDAAEAIARHACVRSSGRVGRTAAARALSNEAVDLAVRAHIRHTHTPYDMHLMSGWDRAQAREAAQSIVDSVVERWRVVAGNGPTRHGLLALRPPRQD